MQLTINGVKHELHDVSTMLDVIEQFGLLGKPIVAEADGRVLTAEQWADTPVSSNMSIELVHFVGGG